MWPELCARRFVTSPVTQIEPTDFSSNRLTCAVNSETDKTLRVASAGNNSPKSHCDLLLLIAFFCIRQKKFTNFRRQRNSFFCVNNCDDNFSEFLNPF